jgi:hypothetical protein
MIWIEQGLGSWRCSECAWVFNLSRARPGKSFEEMMGNFQLQRDKEFTVHVCADYPRAKSTGSKE